MSIDLILEPSCCRCGSTVELYGSTCKHLTLCMTCGKSMAENRVKCHQCGTPITILIREYNVRVCSSREKNYFIGKFVMGIPTFKNNKWSMHKEGLDGGQVTDTLREKCKNRPWLLEDETGQCQYHAQLEGQSQLSTYYLLMLRGKEFIAFPASSWYNFNKVVKHKKLINLEEAEEKMKNRRKMIEAYQRQMMNAAKNGPAAFGVFEDFDDQESAAVGGKVGRNTTSDEEEENVLDRGEGDEDEEAPRKNKKGGGGDSSDDNDIEKGDWEHEEIFTDDDEAVGYDSEELEKLAPEIPAPPETKQDDEDEDEEEGGLSKSGKELKKLLSRAKGLNDSEDDSENDISPVLASKEQAPNKEPVANISSLKASTFGAGHGTPSTLKSSKGKRKSKGDKGKATNGTPLKKIKTENEVKSVKGESAAALKSTTPPNGASSPASRFGSTPTGPVTEDEIKAVLSQQTPVTTKDLIDKFKPRLKLKENERAFADTAKRILMTKKINGVRCAVLKERSGS